jgi:hypothetical protein
MHTPTESVWKSPGLLEPGAKTKILGVEGKALRQQAIYEDSMLFLYSQNFRTRVSHIKIMTLSKSASLSSAKFCTYTLAVLPLTSSIRSIATCMHVWQFVCLELTGDTYMLCYCLSHLLHVEVLMERDGKCLIASV